MAHYLYDLEVPSQRRAFFLARGKYPPNTVSACQYLLRNAMPEITRIVAKLLDEALKSNLDGLDERLRFRSTNNKEACERIEIKRERNNCQQIFHTGSTEGYLLAAMAYDRYAAICKPLHYVQIMNKVSCRCLVGGAWALGFLCAMTNILPALELSFCGPNIIRDFSCEFPSLLALSCTETSPNWFIFLISGSAVASSSLIVILVSYIHIISTILKLNSTEAKKKTFSTCSSHLIVVVLYYGTACFRNMRPSSASSVIIDELFSIQYKILTPMLNPLIYSLKNREVKEAIKKLMGYKALISCTM
ncbi:olfactory receptor 8H3-like [Liasis olivaceus]